MMQSEVIRYVYEWLEERMAKLGEMSETFSMKTGQEAKTVLKIAVKDICQTMNDKSGQRIIVDEMQYEQPACFEVVLAFILSGKKTEDVLSAYGEIVVDLKDNPFIDIGECKWHGCSDPRIFLEPLVRKPDYQKIADLDGNMLELDYRFECSINSRKNSSFRRVEQRILHSNIKNKEEI